MRRSYPTLLALAVCLGCAPAGGTKPAEAPPTDVKLQIADYDGLQALIKSHQGKVVVLDVWNTSCEPCLREFPGLVALHKKYGPERLACISLNLDYEGLGKPEDKQAPVLAFLKEKGATFDNVLSGVEPDIFYKLLKIPSVPSILIYDRAGNLAHAFKKECSYKTDVEPVVEKVMSTP